MPEFLKKTSTVSIILIVAIVGLGIYFYQKGKNAEGEKDAEQITDGAAA